MQTFQKNKNTHIVSPKIDSQVTQIRTVEEKSRKRAYKKVFTSLFIFVMLSIAAYGFYFYRNEIRRVAEEFILVKVEVPVDEKREVADLVRDFFIPKKKTDLIHQTFLLFDPLELNKFLSRSLPDAKNFEIEKIDHNKYTVAVIYKRKPLVTQGTSTFSVYYEDGTVFFTSLPQMERPKDDDLPFKVKERLVISYDGILPPDNAIIVMAYDGMLKRFDENFEVVEKRIINPDESAPNKILIKARLKTSGTSEFDVNIDPSQDADTSLEKFFSIWDNLSDEKKSTLVYIDLRFEGRAFVCLINTACNETK